MTSNLDSNLGTRLEKLGWLQGSVLKEEDFELIKQHAHFPLPIKGDIAVISAHSCNIALNKIQDDPFMLIMIGQTIDALIEEFAFNKHPRILQATLKRKTGDENIFENVFVQFKAFQEITISKEIFLELTPSKSLFLTDQDLRSFVAWLAARSSRPALPTAFNERIGKADRKQKRRKTAKSLEAFLTGIYIEIIPDAEINDDQNYSVNLLGLVSAEYEGGLEHIKQLVNNIAEVMRAAKMDVVSAVSREDEISVATLKRFKRFYYDDLSIRNNNELPPEVNLQL
ncbi:MAG: hypothetical protein WC785_00980 [Tatlockia sp.]|jgi:hypothetical protein